jgi:choline dehydrogenase-like flavoprotein
VRVFLYANATELLSDPNGKKMERVRVATLTGNTFSVVARVVVLATGGIENARLLLASRAVQPNGLGNDKDIVGRYFMEHPRAQSLRVKLPPNCDRRLYDHSFSLVRQRLKLPRMPIAVHFAPTESHQHRLKISNSRTYMVASSFERLLTISRSIKALANGRRPTRLLAASEIARNGPAGTLAAIDFVFNLKSLPREYRLETVIEPIPNRDSRVTLGTEKDQLGMYKVRLDWRLTEADRRNWIISVDSVVTAMKKQNFIFLDPTKDLGEFWDANIQWCWHHMGTTRMDPDPAKGVVDANCRVHGIDNLFVAGSSIFPTAGSDTPTLTIVALALRLSSHLKSVLSNANNGQTIQEIVEAR